MYHITLEAFYDPIQMSAPISDPTWPNTEFLNIRGWDLNSFGDQPLSDAIFRDSSHADVQENARNLDWLLDVAPNSKSSQHT
jgi:hypothetical protein